MKIYKINIFHPFSIDHISLIMVFKCVLEKKTLTWIIKLSFFEVMKYIDLVYD
jgi:Na+-transporting NADH:ubiquinone oxidoreductase subunit NqrE